MVVKKKDLVFASLSIGIAVVFGALGAHFLKSLLNDAALSAFKTGVQYQLFMSLGLLTLSNVNIAHCSGTRLAVNAVKLGTLLFSGSIYLLTIKNLATTLDFLSIAGPITPIGGILLVFGWLKIAFHISKSKE